MPKVEQNKSIEQLLASAEAALEEGSFETVISLLGKVVAKKKETQVKGESLADAYYDLASAYEKAAAACGDKSKVKDYLQAGISTVNSAKAHYPNTTDFSADKAECNRLIDDLSQRLKALGTKKRSKIPYRQYLIEGTLIATSIVNNRFLELTLKDPWNTSKAYSGARKMLAEIANSRPSFRQRLELRSKNIYTNTLRFKILDQKIESAESYLEFIQKQAVTNRSIRYIDFIAEGKIITKVVKSADKMTLELAPSLSKEEIFNINVALYNKHFSSEEFKRYFGAPSKNRANPTMQLLAPAMALSVAELKELICRLCMRKSIARRLQAQRDADESSDNHSLTIEETSHGSTGIASDDVGEDFPVRSEGIFPLYDAYNKSARSSKSVLVEEMNDELLHEWLRWVP